jgi:hypothetical protein
MRITLEEMRTEEDDVSAVVMEDAPDRRHHMRQRISYGKRARKRPSKYIP